VIFFVLQTPALYNGLGCVLALVLGTLIGKTSSFHRAAIPAGVALGLLGVFVLANPNDSGGFLSWLESQWFFLLALVGGAMHAGRAEQRIKNLEAAALSSQLVRDDMIELKANVKHMSRQ
jgi:hypothetical protein